MALNISLRATGPRNDVKPSRLKAFLREPPFHLLFTYEFNFALCCYKGVEVNVCRPKLCLFHHLINLVFYLINGAKKK